MTAPKIGERHRECAREIFNCSWDASTHEHEEVYLARLIAKHFPEDDSWVERAAEEIVDWIEPERCSDETATARIIEIINGCRR